MHTQAPSPVPLNNVWRFETPHFDPVSSATLSPATLSPATPDCAGQADLGWYLLPKHVADWLAALVLLVLTLPLLIVAALLVKLTSRGPIVYSQVRLGRNGKPFSIFKLRTMVHNCESMTGPQWSKPGDNRVTPVGRFLRRSHLDELPQLWNVLRGDMSLVGPRPERPEFVPQLEQAIPFYRGRLLVRPGITGLAQVQLPPDTDLYSVRRKLAHDVYYIRCLSFWLDFRILLATLFGFLCVPYAVTRVLLRLPGGPSVEKAYEEKAARETLNPEFQPV
jgi:lipopolysaccharide/colanic/teichoic acid biosynthesis glycosyltransferase